MKRLNFTTQALDDMTRNQSTRMHFKRDGQGVQDELSRLMREAQKFILPDKGTLLYGAGGLPEGTPFMRLPYPIVIAETTWEHVDSDELRRVRAEIGDDTGDASRRIALAFEVSALIGGHAIIDFSDVGSSVLPLAPPEGGRIDEPSGYVVCCLYRSNEAKCWIPVSGGFYMPYDQTIPKGAVILDTADADDKMRRLRESAGIPQVKKQAAIIKMPVAILPRLLEEHYGPRDDDSGKAMHLLANDVLEEARMVTELCLALSCSNVTTQVDTPSRLGQSERRRARKAPLFDYHLLMIDGRPQTGDASGGGTHASPRTHLRRGHLRRLPRREERIWINDTIVNPGNGFVAKDYAVTDMRGTL